MKETVLLIREGKDALLIHAVRNTLRYIPEITDRKPEAGKIIAENYLKESMKVKGCIVSRLTMLTAPLLFLIITGTTDDENHMIGTRGTYYHNISTDEKKHNRLNIRIENEKETREYPHLELDGFEMRGERGKALYLRLDLEGENETAIEEQLDESLRIPERYFFFKGDEIEINGEKAGDTAGFRLKGIRSSEGIKRHILNIRRKERDNSSFKIMRGALDVVMRFENPDIYEERYNASFLINLERCVYEGEESYPDNSGIWGRDFRYRVYGKIRITVFTLDEEI